MVKLKVDVVTAETAVQKKSCTNSLQMVFEGQINWGVAPGGAWAEKEVWGAGLAVLVEAMVATCVLGTVLAIPLGQHLALEWGWGLGHWHVGGQDLPPFGLPVNPRVTQVEGFHGGGRLYPADVRQVLGLRVLGKSGGSSKRSADRPLTSSPKQRLAPAMRWWLRHYWASKAAPSPTWHLIFTGELCTLQPYGLHVVTKLVVRAASGLLLQCLHAHHQIGEQQGHNACEVHGCVAVSQVDLAKSSWLLASVTNQCWGPGPRTVAATATHWCATCTWDLINFKKLSHNEGSYKHSE